MTPHHGVMTGAGVYWLPYPTAHLPFAVLAAEDPPDAALGPGASGTAGAAGANAASSPIDAAPAPVPVVPTWQAPPLLGRSGACGALECESADGVSRVLVAGDATVGRDGARLCAHRGSGKLSAARVSFAHPVSLDCAGADVRLRMRHTPTTWSGDWTLEVIFASSEVALHSARSLDSTAAVSAFALAPARAG